MHHAIKVSGKAFENECRCAWASESNEATSFDSDWNQRRDTISAYVSAMCRMAVDKIACPTRMMIYESVASTGSSVIKEDMIGWRTADVVDRSIGQID
mmetsp:Transcript_47821/g.70791  ORF Transcript_47821/g.70791 Transcript_47821/m.70791 type:complete len:98 (-) Transcript_47821:920-1213(-)